MRTFETGATRDAADHKPDYAGFCSHRAMVRFGEYMHEHRVQPDGSLRSSDNWKKGMPREEYIKSGWRHWADIWGAYERGQMGGKEFEDALCAMIFNVQGLLHETVALREQAVIVVPRGSVPTLGVPAPGTVLLCHPEEPIPVHAGLKL